MMDEELFLQIGLGALRGDQEYLVVDKDGEIQGNFSTMEEAENYIGGARPKSEIPKRRPGGLRATKGGRK